MTPLSDALRRIESATGAALRESSEVSAPPILAAAPLPTTCFDTIGEHEGSSIEVSTVEISCVMPSERSSKTLGERAKLPRRLGKVNLLGDLTGDASVAYHAAAQPDANVATAKGTVGMVVVVRPGAAPTGPSVSSREEQADELHGIRWPVPGEPQFARWSESVPQIALPIGSAGMATRDWVLFLDDCRELFGSVSVVAPVACTRELAWLARRCDTVRLLALAGVSTAAAARQASLRLAQVGGVQPTCLLVDHLPVAAAA